MKISFLLLVVMFSTSAFAKTVARVLEVKGNAFVFYGKKNSKKLFYGDKIEEMSEVMVDDSSLVTLKDEFGRLFHLAGGSYVKLFNNLLEVRNGNVWVSSEKGNAHGVISSANSLAKYTQGQFIYSFDNMDGKSQVLVLTGDVLFSNALEPDLSVKVSAGDFSFVDQQTAKGLPRGATRVGLASYKDVKKLFIGLETLDKTNFDKALFGKDIGLGQRAIASVPSDSSVSGKKGKLIFIETNQKRIPASVGTKDESAYEYYKSIKKHIGKSKKASIAPVRIFGLDHGPMPKSTYIPKVKAAAPGPVKVVHKPVAVKSHRMPASVEKSQLIQEINASGAFEKSLQKANSENKRHPEEVNSLINELKSYGQTYQQDY